MRLKKGGEAVRIKVFVISIMLVTGGCASFNAINELPKEGYRMASVAEVKEKLNGGGITVFVTDKMNTPGAPVAHYYAKDGTMNSRYLKRGWETDGTWSVTEDGTLCHAWRKWGSHCYYIFAKPGAATNYVHAKYGFVNHVEVKVVAGNPEKF